MSVTNYPLVSGVPDPGGGGGGTWGSIAGTLSDQTDLQAALDLKDTVYNHLINGDRQGLYFIDFLQNDRGGLNAAVNAGGGAGNLVTNDSTVGLNTTENAAGVFGMVTGTGTTARACLYGSGQMFLGGNKSKNGYRTHLSALSSATGAYTVYMGFGDNPSAGDMTDGAYFRYTHSVNGGRWEAVVADAGVRTAADTGVAAVASVYSVFEVEYNAAGTEVKFYIDGTLTNTVTAGLPGAGDFFVWLTKIEKSSGADSISMSTDWLYIHTTKSAAR